MSGRGRSASRPAPRRRGATESLLSVVLVLESLLVFFVTLVVFALDVLEPTPAFVGGGLFFVATLVLARLQRFEWAIWLGWVVQALLIASGFLVPMMFFIGVGFAALWTYCYITGRRLDIRNSAFPPADPPAGPTG
ncbi:DUF4233 domain-containing protein [Marisediminicola senii]|uniref:DUF4233 domain-containing protein n=1 Tax=Marisediminicola senii TaxID=2711233 RepID=UPI0013EB312C|nr:DUF4233 domain-containing protein [Marisediminicola senii]